MASLPVPYVVIEKDRKECYLDVPYNAPAAEYDRAAFVAEWYDVFERLKRSLCEHWRYGVDDGDFYIVDDLAPDRMVGIEILKEHALGPLLLTIVHEVIACTEPDYVVHICDSWVFLEMEGGERYPHFNILVEKAQILIYSEGQQLWKRLGVPMAQEERKA
jgi:hypothetical protein